MSSSLRGPLGSLCWDGLPFCLTHNFHDPLSVSHVFVFCLPSLCTAPWSWMIRYTLPTHLRWIHDCFFGSPWVKLLWCAWILGSALIPIFRVHFKRRSRYCSSPTLSFSSKKSYTPFKWVLRPFAHEPMPDIHAHHFPKRTLSSWHRTALGSHNSRLQMWFHCCLIKCVLQMKCSSSS